ncbi:F-box protein [Vitis vinifera]|uniref:F-box protein n=1 Tax=Vitis vinifera TaxID=29760 RepID=A0A438CKC2_VITVI|nr:F-box protein [Vitis vinifera]
MPLCRDLLFQTRKKRKKSKKSTLTKHNSTSLKQQLSPQHQQQPQEEDTEEGFSLRASAPSHKYGVQPLGNLYFSPSSFNSRNSGLGALQILTDELVLEILGFLDGAHLGVLATVSKSFYVFTNHEPLWRNLVLDNLVGGWLCANLEMKSEWLERDNITRRKGISIEDFVLNFEEPNRPVYSDLVREERPLYLFDPKFGEKVPKLGLEYDVPVYFKEDLFSVLGNERPDYRWIIIGPAGSGSSFHIDPNSTSAWNAVIKGSKKWVLFPPEVVPPGVHPSPDGAEVACPVSIVEWFMNFYGATKKWKKKPIECVCKAGEVIFVPNGLVAFGDQPRRFHCHYPKFC